MAIGSMSKVIDHLRRAALAQDAAGMADEQLLACFVARQDQAAFEALLRRHGTMVLGVCRRVLGHSHDAEDAFQVTFLVLVRKAASIEQPELLGNWLYGVAYRTAHEARTRAVRRRIREKQVPTMPDSSVESEVTSQETQQLLDRELSQLADKYRVPVILCELQGRSRKEVASLLRVPEGTVSSRLATARKLLAGRLAGRGVVLSASALATALTAQTASACVPSSLIHTTVQAAMSLTAGQASATAVISAELASLLEGVLRTMFLTQLKKTATVVLLAAIIGSGMGLFGHDVLAEKPVLAGAKEVPAAVQAGQKAVTVNGQFVSFQEGVLRIKVQQEKGNEPKELNWKIVDDTKVVSVIKGVEQESIAREAFKSWESGAVISVKIKDEKVTFIQIGVKQWAAADQVGPKEAVGQNERTDRGQFVSFKDGTLTLKANSGALLGNKTPENTKTLVWNHDENIYKPEATAEALNQVKGGTWVSVHVANENVTIRIGARKGQTVGTFVSFKNDRLLVLGKNLGESFVKKYGNNVHFNKFREDVPVYESVDGGEYQRVVGAPSAVLANVKEGTVITVHGEGDDNITLIQIGVPKQK